MTYIIAYFSKIYHHRKFQVCRKSSVSGTVTSVNTAVIVGTNYEGGIASNDHIILNTMNIHSVIMRDRDIQGHMRMS
jgi:hypothetical protein